MKKLQQGNSQVNSTQRKKGPKAKAKNQWNYKRLDFLILIKTKLNNKVMRNWI